jgi:hypothetical protein
MYFSLSRLERLSFYAVISFLIVIPGSAFVAIKAGLFVVYYLIGVLIMSRRGVTYSVVLSSQSHSSLKIDRRPPSWSYAT